MDDYRPIHVELTTGVPLAFLTSWQTWQRWFWVSEKSWHLEGFRYGNSSVEKRSYVGRHIVEVKDVDLACYLSFCGAFDESTKGESRISVKTRCNFRWLKRFLFALSSPQLFWNFTSVALFPGCFNFHYHFFGPKSDISEFFLVLIIDKSCSRGLEPSFVTPQVIK